jgi:hypothetical protein
MQIRSIKISGFRGIPPVDPPNVDINLVSPTGEMKDLLLFGPNAYGKSSIADALEWFFKEKVRGGNYYEEYNDQDNIHLKVGQPNFPATAYIELLITHDGNDYTVRKEIDASGRKSGEDLAGLNTLFNQIKDEIIVLDHDQFRNFVAAANDRKWTTFASLIGFEELDHFRAGIESLSSKSITDYLQKAQLEKDVNTKRQQLQSQISQTAERYEVKSQSIYDLQSSFWTRFEITLASLNYPIPNQEEQLSSQYWDDLRKKIRMSETSIKASRRLGELQGFLTKLSPFEIDLVSELKLFVDDVANLKTKKQFFDKAILAEFYKSGLQIIQEQKT